MKERIDLSKKLLLAAATSNPTEIPHLLKQGADINTKDQNGNTALILAIKANNTEMAKLLIENGADLDVKDQNGNTALILAIRTHNTEMAKLLIENGADLNVKGRDGNTALILSTRVCWIEMIKLLIENGADLDVKDQNGNTALILAIRVFNAQASKLLIENGADINIEYDDATSTSTFIKNSYRKVSKFMAEKIKIYRQKTTESSDTSLDKVLENAILNSHREITNKIAKTHFIEKHNLENTVDLFLKKFDLKHIELSGQDIMTTLHNVSNKNEGKKWLANLTKVREAKKSLPAVKEFLLTIASLKNLIELTLEYKYKSAKDPELANKSLMFDTLLTLFKDELLVTKKPTCLSLEFIKEFCSDEKIAEIIIEWLQKSETFASDASLDLTSIPVTSAKTALIADDSSITPVTDVIASDEEEISSSDEAELVGDLFD